MTSVAWALAALATVVAVQTGVVGWLIFARRCTVDPTVAKPDEAVMLKANLEAVERRLAARLDTVTDRINALEQLLNRLASRPAQESDSPIPHVAGENSTAVATMSAPPQESLVEPELETSISGPAVELHPQEVARQLGGALVDSEFCEAIWPGLIGDFFTSRGLLAKYLNSLGIREVDIDPLPALQKGNPHHWEFLLARPRRHTPETPSFLIPRPFGRFDPSFHKHLFEAQGQSPNPDPYFRQLRRCAVIRSAAIRLPIEEALVIERGVVSLSPPESGSGWS